MELKLKNLADFCQVYIDDIVIVSETFTNHLLHLELVFSWLQQLNITLKLVKSFIRYPNVQLLSVRVDALGMTTMEEKTKAIQELQFPTTLADVEQYLSLVGSLHHYIKDYAAKATPLEEQKALLLKGSPLKGQARKNFVNKTMLHNPTTLELEAFNVLQSEFKKPMFLIHFSQDCQLYIELDSSKESGHGAIVYHMHSNYAHNNTSKPPPRNRIKPIMFLSRRLTQAEKNYWPTELEVSCMVWVIKKI